MKKRIISLLLAAAMIISLLPTVVFAADEHTHDTTFLPWVASEHDGKQLPDTQGSYYLMDDVTLSTTWEVPAGTTKLCLNGHVIKMNVQNRVITVGSDCTLNLYDCNSDNISHDGYIDADGLWHLGTVGYNSETCTSITITGGVITGGNSNTGGGVHIEKDGVFNMYGGTIAGNTTLGSDSGGGVNVSTDEGGTNGGIFRMYGGTIAYNNNMGVYAGRPSPNLDHIDRPNVTFEMYGGTIAYNFSKYFAGGIGLGDEVTLKLYGGKIIGNKMMNDGSGEVYAGGIYFPTDADSFKIDFTLGGTIVIKDNTNKSGAQSNLIFNDAARRITIDATTPPAVGMCVGVWRIPSTYGTQLTSGCAFTLETMQQYFFMDSEEHLMFLDSGNIWVKKAEAKNITTDVKYAKVQSAVEEAAAGDEIKLVTDCGTQGITINKNITLDLNGKVLKRSTGNGSVITVGSDADLTITDSNPDVVHKFAVDATGLWTLYESGGTEIVSGGVITGGNATSGGGICVQDGGKLVISGGTVAGNTASMAGGGVYVADGGEITMTGGGITGNTASMAGGGVVCVESAPTIGGTAVIRGNTMNGAASNLFLYDGTSVALDSTNAPQTGMSVGVSMQTPGVFAQGAVQNHRSYFFPDDAQYCVVYKNDSKLALEECRVLNVTTGTTYGSIEEAFAEAVEGDTIQLLTNVTTAGITAEAENLTLDLKGYVLNGDGSGSVITVGSDADLTITDSDPAAEHKFAVDGGTGLWTLDEAGGTETVTGGVITGGNATSGGGICVQDGGKLVISGGTVAGNTASMAGGGVYVADGGEITMTGGKIAGNAAENDSGVYVADGGEITMTGGEITGNDGEKYIPVDTDGDGNTDTYIPATKNADGSYEDEDGNTYTSVDTDENGTPDYYVLNIPVDIDGDGTADDIPVKKNDDGSYTGNDGKKYIPVDKDGDGNTDTYVQATKNADGSYTGNDGKKYTSVDTDGDGKPDTYKLINTHEPTVFDDPSVPEQNATVPEKVAAFVDVTESDAYYDAVKWAVENGITTGIDAVHFEPYETATRGQMVTFLWRAAGSPKPKTIECPFTDVNKESAFYEAILWAVENGITKGVTPTTFEPSSAVNRGQAVTFLARLAGVTDNAEGYTHSFTDVSSGSTFSNAVAWAYNNKITNGTSETTFSPKNPCLRWQIVTFLYRHFVK